MPRRPDSLQRLLARWLLGPLAALILVSAIPTYLTAIRSAKDAYDSSLLDPALAIASHINVSDEKIEIGLPVIALDALRIDSVDRMFFQVLGPDNQRVAGNATIPLPPDPLATDASDHGYYDTAVDGENVRVAALSVPHRHGRILVQVAETLIKREHLIRELLLSTLIPELVVAMGAVALCWYGIGRGLKPLDRLRVEIASRSPVDLRPLDEAGNPREIRPLVAALNNLLQRLGAAIESEQRFIANAAHQLRTPLAGLKTHAELARRDPAQRDISALLDMIAGETERTSHMVNQLLTLARSEPGVGHMTGHAPVNLHEVASRAVQSWVARADARNVDLGFELQEAWTLGDALLLRELLANLLDNAIAYSDEGSTVTVRTHTAEQGVVLEVEDNGIGIPESERQRVFERFYRITGTQGEGCGLGLSIVAEIAQRHDAMVNISTGTDGRGTCVRVTFKPLTRVHRTSKER
jgi:two-component system sensor histidine kinase TctE